MAIGGLTKQVRSQENLLKAWQKIRANGLRSLSRDTRRDIAEFDQRAVSNIQRIQRQLRVGSFHFAAQSGIAKQRKGKRPRPIVLAPVENRVVQRALLQVLQKHPAVRRRILAPTSFGGLEGRRVVDAIGMLNRGIANGARYFLRSDIADFFAAIPRQKALRAIQDLVHDLEFSALLDAATQTDLLNLDELGEDAEYFPTRTHGVAQGNPLSALMGNLLLEGFDTKLNGRGITCLRYIDDFILLGPSRAHVRKAFLRASSLLGDHGMTAYDPDSEPEKANEGSTSKVITFLGVQVSPGIVQPSRAARARLMSKVREEIARGKTAMRRAAKGQRNGRGTYVQTLASLNRVIEGWGKAFAFCSARQTFEMLDNKITEELNSLRGFAALLCKELPADRRRRVLGVYLLVDTMRPGSPASLPEPEL